ncbi:MAG TPA: hypothetical protein VHP35_18690, partial [Terriglobia bacterium]|nr:hypothetical protein [Terriglobia bacterium]
MGLLSRIWDKWKQPLLIVSPIQWFAGIGRVSLSTTGDGFPRGRVLGGRASAARGLRRDDQF